MNDKNFKKHCRHVEEYLSGKRNNAMICTNKKIAKALEKKYEIKMVRINTLSRENGLYMYQII